MSKKPIQNPILAIKKLHFEPGDMLVIFTDHSGYSEQSMRNIDDVLTEANTNKTTNIPVLVLHGSDSKDVQVQKGHEGKIRVELTNLEYLTLMRERKGLK